MGERKARKHHVMKCNQHSAVPQSALFRSGSATPIATRSIVPIDEIFLSEKQLAMRWSLASAKKLQADRGAGLGCPWVKIGRAVRYRMSDIVAYEIANLRTSTSGG